MVEHITVERIANAIMLNTSFNGYYLIVEGPKDSNLYGKFVDDKNIAIKEAFGNQRVQNVLELLEERGFDRKIGVIDSDFRKITGDLIELDGLFLTDDHDIEIMVIKTKALESVVRVFCSKAKIESFEKKNGKTIREKLLELGTEIGYLKLASKTYDLGLVFKPKNPEGNQLKYKNFISDKTLEYLGDEKLIETVFNYSINRKVKTESKEVINQRLLDIKKDDYDVSQLVNGHDLSNVLFILMKKVLGSKNNMLYDHNAVEDSLTLAFDYDDFKATDLYKNLETWSVQNQIQLFK
ncbi:DUF4435 domain-containing protein [Nonlabens xiamenensis]|uniref:DUF4435 domain-containing protein n=1 Tax=Nonlabens xiamenensis TaxID=2341043 RepID=UPI000F60B726|nr:DUF4435 domain-containing protein [Nonlabens xiamenensis]